MKTKALILFALFFAITSFAQQTTSELYGVNIPATNTTAWTQNGTWWYQWRNNLLSPYTQLLAHYDGTEDSTTFVDSDGTCTLTAAGNAKLKTATKKFGSASVYCDGSGDYVTITNFPALGTAAWTIEFWINPVNVTKSWQRLFGTNGGAGNNLMIFRLGGADISIITKGASPGASGVVTAGEWQHIALTFDGVSTMRLFRNGVLLDTEACTNYALDFTTAYGPCYYTSGDEYFYGYMDELRVTTECLYTANFDVLAIPYQP